MFNSRVCKRQYIVYIRFLPDTVRIHIFHKYPCKVDIKIDNAVFGIAFYRPPMKIISSGLSAVNQYDTSSNAIPSVPARRKIVFSEKIPCIQNTPTPGRSNAKRTRKRRGRSGSGVTEGGFFRPAPSEKIRSKKIPQKEVAAGALQKTMHTFILTDTRKFRINFWRIVCLR